MDETDANRTDHEFALLERSFWLRTRLSADARRHLHHGFLQRLLMLQAGRFHLLENADPADLTPRGPTVGTELSLHANAYYLNVRGGLDNLAWCLQYQWSVIPGVTEAKGRRTAIDLANAGFLDALGSKHPQLSDNLRSELEWMNDLSSRRDPAAHRIPLQVPHTVFGTDDAANYETTDAGVAVLMRAGDYASGRDLLMLQSALGEFRAWLVQSTSSGPSIVALHTQVGSDHDRFLGLSENVVGYLEKRVTNRS